MSSSKRFVTQTEEMWLEDDGIMRVVVHKGARENGETVKQSLATHAECTAGRRVPVLVDSTGIHSQSREARLGFASNPCTAALALIVSSPVSRVIGNFYFGVHKTDHPTRMFAPGQEDAALRWLRQFL